jgi:hypothetical protein
VYQTTAAAANGPAGQKDGKEVTIKFYNSTKVLWNE